MVLLDFVRVMKGNRKEVFDFVGNFENCQNWDPGCKESKKDDTSKPCEIGATYSLVTIFKGQESKMTTTCTVWEPNVRVRLEGATDKAITIDDISFKDGPTEGTTEVHYVADIRLKGLLKLATPFVSGDIRALGPQAMDKMEQQCKDRFGSK